MEALRSKVFALGYTLVEFTDKYMDTSSTTFRLAASAAAILVTTLVLRYFQASLPSRPIPYAVAPPEPASPARTVEVTSLGDVLSPEVQCYAPATGQFLGTVPVATEHDINTCVAAATVAQEGWARTTFAQRKAVLRTLLRHVLDNAAAIARVAALDSGKTPVDAQLGEILVTAERISWTLAHGERALAPQRRPTNLLMAYKRNEVRYEPLGVVAALVSWNYPFHNMMGPVISSLFAGDAVVVKVSEQTAWSSAYFADIARGALAAHGHDPNLVQRIVTWPHTAGCLTSHPGIAHITFIGSQPVARLVALDAAKSLTPVVAELGGKDPFIVLDSAASDLPRIVEIILRGTFQAAGQNCIGVERVIAAGLHDRLVDLLQPRVKAIRLGPDADVGAMISDSSFDRLEELIAEAVSQGARLLAGGQRHIHPKYPKGHYFQPTLLADVTPTMRIAQHECFAPILVLMRAPSSTADAMLAIANAPDFGLGASVFGAEADPAMQPIVRGLRAGMVSVNDWAAYYAVQLPFGGARGSGYGRFAGEEGLRGLCNIKSVCEDRFPRLGIRTALPPPVQYPVASQAKAAEFAFSVTEIGYGEPPRKLRGLRRMFDNM